MTEPSKSEVDATLAKLEPPKFVSDAERLKLPVSNKHDSGQPLLPVDEILRRSHREVER